MQEKTYVFLVTPRECRQYRLPDLGRFSPDPRPCSVQGIGGLCSGRKSMKNRFDRSARLLLEKMRLFCPDRCRSGLTLRR